MTTTHASTLPSFETVALERTGRLLTITLNRPDTLNAVDQQMHEDLIEVFAFVAKDEHSDVVVLTGAGRAFSAGGDLAHLANTAARPELFDDDLVHLRHCRRLRWRPPAAGRPAPDYTIVVFAADNAKIGDPHVNVGLVAGDGGAVVWPQLIGFARAKEYLMTGELVQAKKAEELGLINHCVPAAELDGAVDAFCQRLLNGSTNAIRWTKVLVNLELKRIAHALMDRLRSGDGSVRGLPGRGRCASRQTDADLQEAGHARAQVSSFDGREAADRR